MSATKLRPEDARGWFVRSTRLWRASLQLRTVTITLMLTSAAIILVGGYISLSVANDLFQSRRDAALNESRRAVMAAQTTLDAADVSERDSVRTLLDAALRSVQLTTASSLIAAYRIPGQELSDNLPPDRKSAAPRAR